MHNDRTAGFTEAELLEQIPALRCFAGRFHSSATDVDDLVQETLVKAIISSERFERGTRLRSWLFTIMRNTFCTKFRISKRERVGGLDDWAESAATPPTQDWEVRGRELEVAISTLPENFRAVFNLVIIEGASYEAAADQFGVPIGTIKSRVNRARCHLTHVLNGD